MGTFQVEIEIGGTTAENWVAVSALVDTGATMTAVPASVLKRLDVEPTTRKAFQFAQGEVRTMDVGYARVRVEDQEIITQVLFNDEGTPPLLGAIALENAFLGVDPLAQRLVPIHGLMMSYTSAQKGVREAGFTTPFSLLVK